MIGMISVRRCHRRCLRVRRGRQHGHFVGRVLRVNAAVAAGVVRAAGRRKAANV